MKTDDRARCKHIGDEGEKKLFGKTVSVAGLGGAGAKLIGLLARENLNLRLVDRGRVEEEDMHRLSLYYEEDITKFKVKQAKARLLAINPTVQVKSFHEEITDESFFLFKGDVMVDATNNDEINAMTLVGVPKKKIPLLIVRYSGSKARILVLQKKAPAKLLEKIAFKGLEEEGVYGPIASVAGSLAAGEVLKVLLGEKKSYIVEVDIWTSKMKVVKL
ncbi:MAG: ThiF family adenylyltransferase [Candidatus Woesearchaeota archaeon]|nr:ThiF family adenylyltransferase [Candidatus Woesearchaeota archaeon]